ncbi:MAG TPA: hypothetical protein VIW21_00130 [Chthoniobacterales bacterium]|jgi:hypothetical protein
MIKPVICSLLCVVSAILLAASRLAAADQPLATVVRELKAQQAQISDNETKIEAKVANLAETIRVARIFTSRGGGVHKPPKK